MYNSHVRLDIDIHSSHIQRFRTGNNAFRVEWSPLLGLIFENGSGQSPAMNLYHEIMHAVPIFDAFEQLNISDMEFWQNNGFPPSKEFKQSVNDIILEYIKTIKTYNPQYDNDEEERVIAGPEKRACDAIPDESSREDHKGKPKNVSSPTEVPKKKRKKRMDKKISTLLLFAILSVLVGHANCDRYKIHIYTFDSGVGLYIHSNEEICQLHYDNYLLYKGIDIYSCFTQITDSIIVEKNIVKQMPPLYTIQHVFIKEFEHQRDTFGFNVTLDYCLYRSKYYSIPKDSKNTLFDMLPCYYFMIDAYLLEEMK